MPTGIDRRDREIDASVGQEEIFGGATSSDDVLSKMLAQLRPHAMMLVISSADEYIKDMLTALRA